MTSRLLWLGAGAGFGVGFVVAVTMAYLGWRENPSGIYHDAAGTNWTFVWDTAFSWFWPVVVILVPAIWFATFIWRQVQARR